MGPVGILVSENHKTVMDVLINENKHFENSKMLLLELHR
jgi:hypothetical protein